jgi:hypothetical protein
MGRTGNQVKWNKPDSERQISHFLSYVESRLKKKDTNQVLCLTPVILATWETEFGQIMGQGQPG